MLGAGSFVMYHRPLAQSVTAYARQSIILTREIVVQKLQGKLLASDTDSVTYQLHESVCTPAQINDQIAVLNAEIAARLSTHHMTVAIEEVIAPSAAGLRPFVNFSRKSYMFTYLQ